MGLFSLMDALLGRPMSELVTQIALPEETRIALSGGDNLLRKVCELVESYEKADWVAVSRQASKLRLQESALFRVFLESVRWATEVFYGTSDTNVPPQPPAGSRPVRK